MNVSTGVLAIPYEPQERKTSTNHGYVHLRARPDLIDAVPEVAKHPTLRDLLRAINAPSTIMRSVGCEISVGPCKNPHVPELKAKATSYVDVNFVDVAVNTDPRIFDVLLEDIQEFAADYPNPSFFGVEPELRETWFRAEDRRGWTLTLWMTGAGTSEHEAYEAWIAGVEILTAYFQAGGPSL